MLSDELTPYRLQWAARRDCNERGRFRIHANEALGNVTSTEPNPNLY